MPLYGSRSVQRVRTHAFVLIHRILASPEHAAAFARDGFAIVRGLFTEQEARVLSGVCRSEAPRQLKPYFWGIPNAPDTRNIYNAVCFSQRIVGAMTRSRTS